MERTLAGWDHLATALRHLDGWGVDTCLVDNRRTTGGPQPASNGAVIIAGDNSAREFSGYQAGREYMAANAPVPDVWLFVNDRYDAYHDPLQHLTAEALHLAGELGALAGHLDAYPRPTRSFGMDFSTWVATSLVLAGNSLLERLGSLVSITEAQLADVLHDDFSPQRSPFRDEGPVEPEYAAYLMDWLTDAAPATGLVDTWYRRMTLSPDTWSEFRGKVQSILNEHLLSARSRALGMPVLSLDVLENLASMPRGSRAVEAALQDVRTGGPTATRRLSTPWQRIRLATAALAHRPRRR